jgi:hypothetical protein
MLRLTPRPLISPALAVVLAVFGLPRTAAAQPASGSGTDRMTPIPTFTELQREIGRITLGGRALPDSVVLVVVYDDTGTPMPRRMRVLHGATWARTPALVLAFTRIRALPATVNGLRRRDSLWFVVRRDSLAEQPDAGDQLALIRLQTLGHRYIHAVVRAVPQSSPATPLDSARTAQLGFTALEQLIAAEPEAQPHHVTYTVCVDRIGGATGARPAIPWLVARARPGLAVYDLRRCAQRDVAARNGTPPPAPQPVVMTVSPGWQREAQDMVDVWIDRGDSTTIARCAVAATVTPVTHDSVRCETRRFVPAKPSPANRRRRG